MSDDYDDYYDADYYEPEPQREQDPSELRATEELGVFFRKYNKRVFYFKQIQLIFEKRDFHWITARAIKRLEEEGVLKSEMESVGDIKVHFVWHRSFRYQRRTCKKMTDLISEHSTYEVGKSCGEQAEHLFELALLERNFHFHAKHTNKFGRKVWRKTKHDLDFIVSKDSIVYGIEVKNTFDYIDRKEFEIKIEMCKFLKIRPLFVMRYAPKTYIEELNRLADGFALLFKSRVYPSYFSNLVKRVNKAMFLPYTKEQFCIVSSSIPSGIMDRFINYHERLRKKL